jgi:hypothetical protein
MANPEGDKIALTVNIKDRPEPIRVDVVPSITPNEILADLQQAGYVRELQDRTVAFTHDGENLLPTRAIASQGVKSNDTIGITWDGRLAGDAA